MLSIHPSRRFLALDGKPFYWLADTAWHLFHRLSYDEAVRYLRERAQQGFTVIQAVLLCEYGGLEPNRNGDVMFEGRDPAKPNAAYFRHLDRVMDAAAKAGLWMALVPAWGDKVGTGYWGEGPKHFIHGQNARAYGRFLGSRYRDYPVIWMNGGDRPADGNEAIWHALAEGLKEGDQGTHLMTYHPCGGHSSSEWFHQASWLDFNMMQTAHQLHANTYTPVASDYSRAPAKPCLLGECGYEAHPSGGSDCYIDDHYVRMGAYWAVFSGAFGNTYGCHDVWQFHDPSRHPSLNRARIPWEEALQLPGATHMKLLKALLLSKPFFERIPDQSLVGEHQAHGGIKHVRATRDGTPGQQDASYLLAYFPSAAGVGIRTQAIRADRLTVKWFDPRTGLTRGESVIENRGETLFTPPSTWREPDWVLSLERAS